MDTYENFRFSLEIYDHFKSRGVMAIVTEPSQFERFAVTARAYGQRVINIPAPVKMPLRRQIMEWGFLWLHRLDRKGDAWWNILAKWSRESRRRIWVEGQ